MAKMVRDSMERVRTPDVLFLCLLERRVSLEGTSCEFLCFRNKMVHSFISWIAYINICRPITLPGGLEGLTWNTKLQRKTRVFWQRESLQPSISAAKLGRLLETTQLFQASWERSTPATPSGWRRVCHSATGDGFKHDNFRHETKEEEHTVEAQPGKFVLCHAKLKLQYRSGHVHISWLLCMFLSMITIVFFHVSRLAKEIEIAFHGARGHGRTFHQMRRRNGWFLRHRQATTLAGRPRSRHHCASWVGCTSGQIVWWRVPFVCLFCKSDIWLIHPDTFLEVENSFLSKSCQMETDIVGTLLAGSLVAQVGEDKAEHETVTVHLWSHMMSRDITWCPADSWEWNRTDVRGVDWAHFWDQRLGDQEPTAVPQATVSVCFTQTCSKLYHFYPFLPGICLKWEMFIRISHLKCLQSKWTSKISKVRIQYLPKRLWISICFRCVSNGGCFLTRVFSLEIGNLMFRFPSWKWSSDSERTKDFFGWC